MAWEVRHRRVIEYVRDRLIRETETRGVQAKIERETDVTAAHISNIRKGITPTIGEKTLNELAHYWGFKGRGELEEAALKYKTANPLPDKVAKVKKMTVAEMKAQIRLDPKYVEADDAVKDAFDKHRLAGDPSIVAWVDYLNFLLRADADGIDVRTLKPKAADKKRPTGEEE